MYDSFPSFRTHLKQSPLYEDRKDTKQVVCAKCKISSPTLRDFQMKQDQATLVSSSLDNDSFEEDESYKFLQRALGTDTSQPPPSIWNASPEEIKKIYSELPQEPAALSVATSTQEIPNRNIPSRNTPLAKQIPVNSPPLDAHTVLTETIQTILKNISLSREKLEECFKQTNNMEDRLYETKCIKEFSECLEALLKADKALY